MMSKNPNLRKFLSQQMFDLLKLQLSVKIKVIKIDLHFEAESDRKAYRNRDFYF